MKDLKFAFRKLRQSPAFTSIAVFTLALGIGLNTTIFSLINDLFLRGLPFKEPSRIVHLDNGDKARDLADVGISAPRYQLYRDGQTIFDGFAAENFFAFTLTGLGDPVQIFGGRLTSNYFDVLGVRPILGRNFLPEEEERADVALVTKEFLAGTPRRRSECDWAKHHARWDAAHDRWRSAKYAGNVVRGEPDRGSLDDETFSDSRLQL